MVDNTDSPSFWSFENYKSDDILSSTFLQNVCRLCANVSNNVLPIFDKSNEKTSIFSKLKKYLPSISVSENDLKPKHVCLPCISKLESCVSFVDMSLEADSKFEELLQNKEAYEVPVDGSTIPSNNEISWISMKQEPVAVVKYGANKCKNEVDVTSAEFLNQLYQQKAFPQQMVSAFGAPVSLSVTQNQPSPLIQENVGHSILQNLLTQETIPTQDVVVLVEVKCKDAMIDPINAVPKKKMDISRNTLLPSVKITPPVSISTNNIMNQQTKIVDSNGNIRIINLSDFEGKFNHFEKIASSFITDDFVAVNKSPSSTGTFVPVLKTFQPVDQPDVLNVLKLEPFSSDNSLASNENADASEIVLHSPSTTTATTSSTSTSSTNPSKPGGDGFACEVCGKQFTRKSRLNAHVARHSTERPHVCDQCDQTFITKWDLTLHQRIHSGVFSCEFCGKAFPARGKLERHRRTHTGERPFPCNLCNKAFSEKRNLRNHHKIHTTALGVKSNESSSVYNACSCFYLKIENHLPVKNTCDMCRSRNDSNVKDVAKKEEIENCLTVR